MARKRMIDPGLWDSRQFSQLNFMERVLYIGLISNADDEGRLEDRTALIRSKIFPDDDIPLSGIEGALEQLKEVGLIERYTAGEWDIIQHPKWSKYQTINRPKPSKFPAKSNKHNTITDESLMNHGTITDESRLKEVKGKERKGRERAREATPPKNILDGFQPSQAMIDEMKEKHGFSGETISLETEKFIEHRRAKGIDPADPEADWRLWMLRQKERASAAPSGKAAYDKQKAAIDERQRLLEQEQREAEENAVSYPEWKRQQQEDEILF